MKCKIQILLLLLLPLPAICQEPIYFNNVYNPMDNFARGRGVVTVGETYYCLVNTDDPTGTYQSFVWMIIDKYGSVSKQKLFHIPGHSLYPGVVGGTLKRSNDGNFVFAYQAQGGGATYSSLIKFNAALDTVWKKNYSTDFLWTMATNFNLTNEGGYILVGSVKPADGEYWDFLLMKTDSLGNMEWYQTYGTDWSEHGQNVIQTPDGGYLIGGFFWKPGIDHSLDAMVVKTDSLGNEEWTKYFGNPDIDDDMAFVELDEDGNYLVGSVYGEWIHTDEVRTGRLIIYKIDPLGNLIWQKKFNPKRRNLFIKNLKKIDSKIIVTGWCYMDTVNLYNSGGWIYKIDENFDSIWRREYYHFNQYTDFNYLYDFDITDQNGYISIGRSNASTTQANMWLLKLDSLGCDTPGCATGTQVYELPKTSIKQIRVLPNPASDLVHFQIPESTRYSKGTIVITNIHGRQVASIPLNSDQVTWDASKVPNGIYFYRADLNGELVSGKIIINN